MSDDQDPYGEWVIRKYPSWTLYLNPQQYYLGRCYAWLRRFGKMQRMTDLKYSEREELFDSVLPEYERALDGLWRPGQINYAWLCNEIVEHNGHGHMHVIPRYEFPVVFGGHEFKDEQWGHNYDPYPKRALPKKMLFRIRDALRTEIPLLVE